MDDKDLERIIGKIRKYEILINIIVIALIIVVIVSGIKYFFYE